MDKEILLRYEVRNEMATVNATWITFPNNEGNSRERIPSIEKDVDEFERFMRVLEVRRTRGPRM